MRASWVVWLAAALCSTTALAQVNDNIGPINIQPPKNFSQSVIQSPPAQALSVDADLLPIIQPSATPTLRKITPANLLGSSGFAYANACNPVVTYGADPTGVHSANEAINRCNGTQRNGQYVNTFLPGGTYRLTDQVNLTNGQCLVTEPGLTVLSVDYDFSSAGTGVLVFSGGGQYGGTSVPCIKGDPIIVFSQPSNIGSRANFAALGSCGNNGKGCQYPPAINFDNAQRFDIDGITIANAWDCIKGNGSNGGDGNDHWGIVRCGAFNKGLDLSGLLDVVHVDAFFFWPYGMSVANNTGIFQDGSTHAAVFGEVDGFEADQFFTINGRVSINAASGWYHFGNLMLDADNSTLEVTAARWVTVGSGYKSSGTAGSAAGVCPITLASGALMVSNFRIAPSGTTAPICQSGGTLSYANSYLAANHNQNGVSQTGGALTLTGNTIQQADTGASTSPMVTQSGGWATITGNNFVAPPVSGTAFSLTDNAGNSTSGNSLNGWTFAAPGAAGSYADATPFTYTPTIGCVGGGALTTTTSSGRWLRDGKKALWEVEVGVTDHGTCSAYISATLPGGLTSGKNYTITGTENAITGAVVRGIATTGAASMLIAKYDGSTPAVDGYALFLSGMIEVP